MYFLIDYSIVNATFAQITQPFNCRGRKVRMLQTAYFVLPSAVPATSQLNSFLACSSLKQSNKRERVADAGCHYVAIMTVRTSAWCLYYARRVILSFLCVRLNLTCGRESCESLQPEAIVCSKNLFVFLLHPK